MPRIEDAPLGWRPLVQSLIAAMHEERVWNGPPVEITQIKEKFGGLRFYYTGGDDSFRDKVIAAESASYKVCQVCGKPGEFTTNRGWMRTLCEEHK